MDFLRWLSASREKIYQVVREPEKVENRCFKQYLGIQLHKTW